MGFSKFNTSWAELSGKPTNLATLPSFEYWQEIDFTTLNATFQNVWSITLLTNEVINYEIDLLGRLQGTSQIWSAKYNNAVVNNAGVLTQIGNAQQFLRENLTTNANIQTQIVGQTLNFRVNSGTTQVINWKAKIRLYKTTLP